MHTAKIYKRSYLDVGSFSILGGGGVGGEANFNNWGIGVCKMYIHACMHTHGKVFQSKKLRGIKTEEKKNKCNIVLRASEENVWLKPIARKVFRAKSKLLGGGGAVPCLPPPPPPPVPTSMRKKTYDLVKQN